MSKKEIHSIDSLGEFALIDRLTKDVKRYQDSTVVGVGDDAAVIDTGKEYQVITTDMLLEGVHFDLTYSPLVHLGYKSVVVNLSDIYAMNAVPRQITVSLGVSGKFSVEALEEFYSGVRRACELYKVDLVGGDTTASMTGLTISVTAIGVVPKQEVVYRKGALKNHLICVSGDLGAAFMGLKVLEREKRVFHEDASIQPDLTGFEYVVGRFLKPEARVDVLLALRDKGIRPTSMIDISDGLSSELLHICKRSECGCQVYQDKIPMHEDTGKAAAEFQVEPLVAALHGGEDYELLFTVPLSSFDAVNAIPGISVIGNITGEKEKPVLVTNEGTGILLQAQGWDSLGER